MAHDGGGGPRAIAEGLLDGYVVPQYDIVRVMVELHEAAVDVGRAAAAAAADADDETVHLRVLAHAAVPAFISAVKLYKVLWRKRVDAMSKRVGDFTTALRCRFSTEDEIKAFTEEIFALQNNEAELVGDCLLAAFHCNYTAAMSSGERAALSDAWRDVIARNHVLYKHETLVGFCASNLTPAAPPALYCTPASVVEALTAAWLNEEHGDRYSLVVDATGTAREWLTRRGIVAWQHHAGNVAETKAMITNAVKSRTGIVLDGPVDNLFHPQLFPLLRRRPLPPVQRSLGVDGADPLTAEPLRSGKLKPLNATAAGGGVGGVEAAAATAADTPPAPEPTTLASVVASAKVGRAAAATDDGFRIVLLCDGVGVDGAPLPPAAAEAFATTVVTLGPAERAEVLLRDIVKVVDAGVERDYETACKLELLAAAAKRSSQAGLATLLAAPVAYGEGGADLRAHLVKLRNMCDHHAAEERSFRKKREHAAMSRDFYTPLSVRAAIIAMAGGTAAAAKLPAYREGVVQALRAQRVRPPVFPAGDEQVAAELRALACNTRRVMPGHPFAALADPANPIGPSDVNAFRKLALISHNLTSSLLSTPGVRNATLCRARAAYVAGRLAAEEWAAFLRHYPPRAIDELALTNECKTAAAVMGASINVINPETLAHTLAEDARSALPPATNISGTAAAASPGTIIPPTESPTPDIEVLPHHTTTNIKPNASLGMTQASLASDPMLASYSYKIFEEAATRARYAAFEAAEGEKAGERAAEETAQAQAHAATAREDAPAVDAVEATAAPAAAAPAPPATDDLGPVADGGGGHAVEGAPGPEGTAAEPGGTSHIAVGADTATAEGAEDGAGPCGNDMAAAAGGGAGAGGNDDGNDADDPPDAQEDTPAGDAASAEPTGAGVDATGDEAAEPASANPVEAPPAAAGSADAAAVAAVAAGSTEDAGTNDDSGDATADARDDATTDGDAGGGGGETAATATAAAAAEEATPHETPAAGAGGGEAAGEAPPVPPREGDASGDAATAGGEGDDAVAPTESSAAAAADATVAREEGNVTGPDGVEADAVATGAAAPASESPADNSDAAAAGDEPAGVDEPNVEASPADTAPAPTAAPADGGNDGSGGPAAAAATTASVDGDAGVEENEATAADGSPPEIPPARDASSPAAAAPPPAGSGSAAAGADDDEGQTQSQESGSPPPAQNLPPAPADGGSEPPPAATGAPTPAAGADGAAADTAGGEDARPTAPTADTAATATADAGGTDALPGTPAEVAPTAAPVEVDAAPAKDTDAATTAATASPTAEGDARPATAPDAGAQGAEEKPKATAASASPKGVADKGRSPGDRPLSQGSSRDGKRPSSRGGRGKERGGRDGKKKGPRPPLTDKMIMHRWNTIRRTVVMTYGSFYAAFDRIERTGEPHLLDVRELRAAMMSIGLHASDAALLVKLLDVNRSGEVSRTEWMALMRDEWPPIPPPPAEGTIDALLIELRGVLKKKYSCYEDAFDKINTNMTGKDNVLDLVELRSALLSLGMDARKTHQLFSHLDADQNGIVSRDEFMAVLDVAAASTDEGWPPFDPIARLLDPETLLEERWDLVRYMIIAEYGSLRAGFAFMNQDSKAGNRVLSQKEFWKGMNRAKIPEGISEGLLALVDRDGSGTVTWQEFRRVLDPCSLVSEELLAQAVEDEPAEAAAAAAPPVEVAPPPAAPVDAGGHDAAAPTAAAAACEAPSDAMYDNDEVPSPSQVTPSFAPAEPPTSVDAAELAPEAPTAPAAGDPPTHDPLTALSGSYFVMSGDIESGEYGGEGGDLFDRIVCLRYLPKDVTQRDVEGWVKRVLGGAAGSDGVAVELLACVAQRVQRCHAWVEFASAADAETAAPLLEAAMPGEYPESRCALLKRTADPGPAWRTIMINSWVADTEEEDIEALVRTAAPGYVKLSKLASGLGDPNIFTTRFGTIEYPSAAAAVRAAHRLNQQEAAYNFRPLAYLIEELEPLEEEAAADAAAASGDGDASKDASLAQVLVVEGLDTTCCTDDYVRGHVLSLDGAPDPSIVDVAFPSEGVAWVRYGTPQQAVFAYLYWGECKRRRATADGGGNRSALTPDGANEGASVRMLAEVALGLPSTALRTLEVEGLDVDASENTICETFEIKYSPRAAERRRSVAASEHDFGSFAPRRKSLAQPGAEATAPAGTENAAGRDVDADAGGTLERINLYVAQVDDVDATHALADRPPVSQKSACLQFATMRSAVGMVFAMKGKARVRLARTDRRRSQTRGSIAPVEARSVVVDDIPVAQATREAVLEAVRETLGADMDVEDVSFFPEPVEGQVSAFLRFPTTEDARLAHFALSEKDDFAARVRLVSDMHKLVPKAPSPKHKQQLDDCLAPFLPPGGAGDAKAATDADAAAEAPVASPATAAPEADARSPEEIADARAVGEVHRLAEYVERGRAVARRWGQGRRGEVDNLALTCLWGASHDGHAADLIDPASLTAFGNELLDLSTDLDTALGAFERFVLGATPDAAAKLRTAARRLTEAAEELCIEVHRDIERGYVYDLEPAVGRARDLKTHHLEFRYLEQVLGISVLDEGPLASTEAALAECNYTVEVERTFYSYLPMDEGHLRLARSMNTTLGIDGGA